MIDVLKRLAELDENNPAVDTGAKVVQPQQNISVNESQDLEECGMMGDMGRPSTPASINITAGSGDEVADMLATIMHLAGKPMDSGMDGDLGAMGGDGIAQVVGPEEPVDSMRSMLDKLNPDMDDDGMDTDGGDDDETKEWSNSGADPTDVPDFDSNKFSNQDPAGHPGVGDRMDGDRPKAFAKEMTYESLMAEYKKFVSEQV